MKKQTAGSIFADLIRAKTEGGSTDDITRLEKDFGEQSVEQLDCGPETEVTFRVGDQVYTKDPDKNEE